MRERLFVREDRISDGDRDAGQGGGQLPQPAEQAVGAAAREQDPAAIFDPERLAIEPREIGGAFARGHDRQLVLAAVAVGHT